MNCLDQSDPDIRLACYDRLAEQARDASEETPTPGQSATSSIVPAAAHPADTSSAPLSPPERATVTSRITKVSTTARGHRAFGLENGQTWIEVEVGRQPIKAGQTVTINKRRWRHVMQLKGVPDIGVRLAD